jgi:hypothetical protein
MYSSRPVRFIECESRGGDGGVIVSHSSGRQWSLDNRHGHGWTMWLVVVVSRQNEQNLRLDKTEEMRRKMEGRKKLSTMMDGFVRQTHTGADQQPVSHESV